MKESVNKLHYILLRLSSLDKLVLEARSIKKGIKITFKCPCCGGKVVLK